MQTIVHGLNRGLWKSQYTNLSVSTVLNSWIGAILFITNPKSITLNADFLRNPT
ncbi:hypothetical protein [Psychroflexus sp. MBR-150]